jgi:hypothetical protein
VAALPRVQLTVGGHVGHMSLLRMDNVGREETELATTKPKATKPKPHIGGVAQPGTS